jgi:hypothetical protein
MIKDDIELLQNKRYDNCSQCHKIIVYDTEAIDRHGNHIPLDIDRKRHHCNTAWQILHEEKIVQEICDDIDTANKFELRYRLELAIPDEKSASSHTSSLPSSSKGHYKAIKIGNIHGR